MGFFEIALIAVSLSMDAFAVSIVLGLSLKRVKIIHYFIPGIYFGFFQALMPFIGYFTGINFFGKIQNMDHWIAFMVLGFIGVKMIKDSISKTEKKINENAFGPINMLFLAVATSIDALAVGVTFSFFDVSIFNSILIIGCTTFFISIAGVKAGILFGMKFKSKAEFMGGAALLILGTKILIQHLF